MSLLPLHKDQLGNDKGDYEDEHHLCVHCLMAFVFGVHSCMLDPVKQQHIQIQIYAKKTVIHISMAFHGRDLDTGNVLLVIVTKF